ncbi:MAG: ribonuclease III [Proteobacteria bacterium]|nr:ribonuclease III [Candidatus Enterousia onthequi]
MKKVKSVNNLTILGYKFQDKSLLELALTQSGADCLHNNERLEFIGDRVLGLSVAGMLFVLFPNEAEGELARRHASLVSTETLARVAKEIGLGAYIRHGHMTAGRLQHVYADAMEAVFGAMFLESGFDTVCDVIISRWRDLAAEELIAPKDAKTELQEFVQGKRTGELPVYEYLSQSGPSHSPVFTASVTALGKTATGVGSSKKLASTAAAAELLKILANE